MRINNDKEGQTFETIVYNKKLYIYVHYAYTYQWWRVTFQPGDAVQKIRFIF